MERKNSNHITSMSWILKHWQVPQIWWICSSLVHSWDRRWKEKAVIKSKRVFVKDLRIDEAQHLLQTKLKELVLKLASSDKCFCAFLQSQHYQPSINQNLFTIFFSLIVFCFYFLFWSEQGAAHDLQ